jgi:hypothetical protein
MTVDQKAKMELTPAQYAVWEKRVYPKWQAPLRYRNFKALLENGRPLSDWAAIQTKTRTDIELAEKSKGIIIVNGSDWMGIYRNGELIYQGHDIQPHRLLELLGHKYKRVEADGDWLASRGALPTSFSEVKGA